MSAFLRRHVSAIEGRFHQTVSIRKDVDNPHKPVTRSPCDITLDRRGVEKTVRHGQCPPRDHWQNWIVLKRHPHQAIWDRGGEQPLDGFPKRIDVHCSMQAKQRPFEYRIDHRLALRANPCDSRHSRLLFAQPLFFCPSLRLHSFPPRSIIRRSKRQPKLPGGRQLVREIQGQR